MDLYQLYLDEYDTQGQYWIQESEGSRPQIRQAHKLFPQVLAQLRDMGELEEHSSRRIWDYCVGEFGDDPVSEIINEL